MKKKILLLSIIAVAVALFFIFDLGEYLSLESLKSNRDQLRTFYEANTATMIVAFIGVYIVTVALSLPGAAILTLCAGAIFGSVMATLVVNVGATVGATLAFLAARFLLRDWVEKNFGEKLKPFNDGFSKNAINYMLFLRLVPLFPFFLINLVSGLTQIRLPVYFFGTMFGTLPGTFVYANAGSNLASINQLSDIASPQVLGAFALLGLFALIPTFYKYYKSRKHPSPEQDPVNQEG
ncbi:MAG: TVP38/TMEM64 family protein [Nitrospinaceae bacterium]|nr:TVP38/TMEM64 family protein [Nitrospinaceae bacterium]NIR54272.1 TVP38/TMEM64 family protein [Nitrospinaceae bacterium]NIS84689.1 TVP38/TMEM64 family protein [Nitrospinaceae bacterium]NIT81484.1 TVP38/TMEM64 family protein [Nitrospinaceae bacterium]NIU43768.1 TVP38/TMEM64 family protein [Nitrospinaceae bacterium]